MILNEAVTLLGYEVDEAQMKVYKKLLKEQEQEALKLLKNREKANIKAEAEKIKAAERAAREQVRLQGRVTASYIKEAAAQARAAERAAQAEIRSAERAAREQEKIRKRDARAAAKERADAVRFARGSAGSGSALPAVVGAVSAGAAVKSVWDTGTQREGMVVGLKNVLGGDSMQALREFRRLEQFNQDTPATLNEIISGYIRLKNIGLDASNEAMKAYGGIAASIPGKKITDFIEAVADGVMGEAERLKEFGIKMNTSGDQVTLKFRGQTIRVKKDAQEIEKALKGIGLKYFGNTMKDLSKTTEGQLSNMTDALDAVKWDIWLSGGKKAFDSLIAGSSSLLKELRPIVKEFSVWARLNSGGMVSNIGTAAKIAGGYLAFMAAKAVGLKLILASEWIMQSAQAIRTLGVAGYFAAGGLGLVPALIGGTAIALGLLVADFVNFFNTGDSRLVQFTKKWPWLSDAIKSAMESWRLATIMLQMGFEKVGKSMAGAFGGIKVWFEWFGGELGRMIQGLKDLAGAAGEISDRFLGTHFTRPDTSLTPSGLSPDIIADNKRAADFAKNARTITTESGRCLEAVWKIHEKTLGKGAAWSTSVNHAYQAAPLLAKDKKRFAEITGVTPDMLMSKDPKIMKMLHGMTIIYDRGAAFSPRTAVSGHAEIFDAVNKSMYFGRGAVSASNRSAFNLKHARFFVPTKQGASMPSYNPAGGGSSVSNQMTLQQNFYGPTDPKKAGKAATDGTQNMLNKARLSVPRVTN